MPTNSQEIVLQIRAQFDALLASVLDTTAQVPAADAVERSLLSGLLELGRLLLLAFFTTQQEQVRDVRSVTVNAKTLPLHSVRTRTLRSVFGKIRVARGYYYQDGPGYYLLDARLRLPAHSASDLLHEWMLHLSCYVPYPKTGAFLARLVAHKPPTREIEDALREDSTLVDAFYEQVAAPPVAEEACLLVAQADGKGVPMRTEETPETRPRLGKGEKYGHKKEAIVTAVYTLAPCARTPEQVTDSLFKTGHAPATPTAGAAKPSAADPKPTAAGEAREGPCHKQAWATLHGKRAAMAFLAQQAARRDGEHIRARVALTDGSAPLQQRVQEYLPAFTLVLDLIHAVEYLWQAANSLHTETGPHRNGWVRTRLLLLLNGQTPHLITELKALAEMPSCKPATQRVLLDVVRYYERNLPYMRYDAYLRDGWPIATGVIEGACRHLVKDRCELSGMRWTLAGAEALLRMRSVAENDDWDAFHAFRQEQRQGQLYGTATPAGHITLERAGGQARSEASEQKAA